VKKTRKGGGNQLNSRRKVTQQIQQPEKGWAEIERKQQDGREALYETRPKRRTRCSDTKAKRESPQNLSGKGGKGLREGNASKLEGAIGNFGIAAGTRRVSSLRLDQTSEKRVGPSRR